MQKEVNMDFSKRGVIKKQHQIKSTTKRLNSKIRVTLFRLSLICVVFVSIIGVLAVYGSAKAMIDNAPELEDISTNPEGFTTHVYYSNGSLSETLIGAEANRVEVSIEEIPDVLEKCFVALEDERFYEHDGIDVRGIFRAGFSVLKTQDLGFGASTITQQLLKNKVFGGGAEESNVDKVVRKVQEQYLAIQLEDKYSKDEIMEDYLNNINLGNGSFGVQTASQSYFGKDVKDLTLSESAVIAAIALSPVRCNPITYPETNKVRRQSCLDYMLKLGYATQEEYDEAVADDIYSRISLHAEEKSSVSYYSYFTDELIDQILSDLQTQKGYTQAQAANLLYSGGLSIYTTQEKKVQKIVDKYFKDESNFPEIGEGSYYELTYALSLVKPDGSKIHYQLSDLLEYFEDYNDKDHKYYHENGGTKGISNMGYDKKDMLSKAAKFKKAMLKTGYAVDGETCTVTIQPQTSMTIIDQTNGNVVAVYGGRGSKTGNRTLNRATDSVRQVGSTFKVLASFLPALDSAGLTLASPFDDSEYFYPGTKTQVQNWNTGVYKGLSTIREGIYNSMNIVACRTLEAVTPQVGFDYLEKLGFTTLVESEKNSEGKVYSDIGVPLALGGLTKGVTNLELTAAYAAIANGGVYNKPIFYTKVLDHDGNVILENESTASQVMKSSTAWLLTSAMQDTVTKGTGTKLQIKNMPVAGKTGTVHDYYDLWFVGYTPYYTAAIWTGFDNNFEQVNKVYHQYLWQKIMAEVHTKLNLETKSFEMPDSIVKATICTKSGKLAVPGLCDHALGGNTTRVEYFAKGTVPTETCTSHVKVSVCTESNHIAGPYCPLNKVKDVVYLVKEETSDTWDTPNILPTGEAATVCPIHSDGSIIPSKEDNSGTFKPSDSETTDDTDTTEKPSTDTDNTTDDNSAEDNSSNSGDTTNTDDTTTEDGTKEDPSVVIIPPADNQDNKGTSGNQ